MSCVVDRRPLCFTVGSPTELTGAPPVNGTDSQASEPVAGIHTQPWQPPQLVRRRLLQAGAYKPLKDAIPIIMRDADVSFTTALKMASEWTVLMNLNELLLLNGKMKCDLQTLRLIVQPISILLALLDKISKQFDNIFCDKNENVCRILMSWNIWIKLNNIPIYILFKKY